MRRRISYSEKKDTVFLFLSLLLISNTKYHLAVIHLLCMSLVLFERFEKRRTCCLRNCEIRSFDHNASPTPLLSPTISSNRSQSNQKSLSKSLNSSSNLNTPRRILINLNWKLSRNSSNSFKRDYRLLS